MTSRWRAVRTATFLLAAAVFSLARPALSQSPALDPQALVGEWWGDWNITYSSGNYFLTITRVEGPQVYGRVEVTGGRVGGAAPYDIEGTFDGKTLRYSSTDKQVTVELQVEGDRMSGRGERAGRYAGAISVTKKKK